MRTGCCHMRTCRITGAIVILLSVLMAVGTILARSDTRLQRPRRPISTTTPAYCAALHDIGKVALTVGNNGTIGTGLLLSSFRDCFTGQRLVSCQYPSSSTAGYLWAGALWIGAIVDGDTLVSTGGDPQSAIGHGYELHPTGSPEGRLKYRSTTDPGSPACQAAVSEEEYIATFYDTCITCPGVGFDAVDNRTHRPLDIAITRSSYSWSYRETEDFVLLDYTVRNIGYSFLQSLYFGIYIDADVHQLDGTALQGYADDHSGFLAGARNPWMPQECAVVTDLNLAWTADNDGDFQGLGPSPAVPAVVGICPLGLPGDMTGVSFNWWNRDLTLIRDFGPQTRATFRFFAPDGLGSPLGDRDKYHLLSNGEVDYHQVRIGVIGGSDSLWLPPPIDTYSLAQGVDTRFVLSIGPVDLAPGENARFPVAFVLGDGFHSVPGNIINLPSNPDLYLDQVDFSDLIRNAVVAGYVYDNPGVDTDGDGYAGEFLGCGDDTVWYRGDGIPDWSAAAPPVGPEFQVEPDQNALRVRWNGWASETSVRWLTGEEIFEGYHVYLALDSAASAFSRLASYDIEDYRRYAWDSSVSDWTLAEGRITVGEAVCRYAPLGCNDPSWHPLDFPRPTPYVVPGFTDSVFYFDPIDANASKFGMETPFIKCYPDVPRPDYAAPEDVPVDSADVYLTPDGRFKYYEYEYRITDLLAGEKYYVSVTAFDCGSPLVCSAPLESAASSRAQSAIPLHSDPSCCLGQVGNANGDPDDSVNLADIAIMVDYLFITGRLLDCWPEVDIDQSGGSNPAPGDITLGDITLLVDHLFINGTPLPDCR